MLDKKDKLILKELDISKNLNVKYNISCENVIHDGKNFIVNTNEGTYHCKFLVCGTGVVPKKPKIKGIELTTSYAEMKSKEFYRGKIVLIIGKGNSGLECAQDIINEASYISCASPNSINFAYKTHYIGDVRIVNSILIENYLLKQNASVLDCKILDIKKVENKFLVKVHYTHANDEIEEIIFDEVVDATGFKSEDSLLKNFNINYIDGKYPEIDENFQSVSIPNLFFSGIQTHGLDYKKTSGGFIHGFRYHSIILANYLNQIINTLKSNKKLIIDITPYIIDRLENMSGIFLMAGSLVLVIEKTSEGWINHGLKTKLWFDNYKENSLIIGVTLEYGDIDSHENILQISRRPGFAELSDHLHPVIRKKYKGVINELHLEEDLFNHFDNKKNHGRLNHFIKNSIDDSNVGIKVKGGER